MRVFTGVDQSLDAAAQAEMLNAQIAKMTWQGYVIIMVPCMLCMIGALVWMLRGIKKLTGLTTEEVLAGAKQPDHEPEEPTPEEELVP